MVGKRNFDTDLLALAALSDEDIDTSDISETLIFENFEIGRHSEIKSRGYDVRSIANWVISTANAQNLKITNLWLNKFIFFIVEKALLSRHLLLTPARIEAWEFGPVFRELYFNFPSDVSTFYQRFNVRKRLREVASEPFEAEDVEIFREIWQEYGHLTASQLTRISHRAGSPWHEVWERGGNVNPGMVIDIDTIMGRNADQGDGNG